MKKSVQESVVPIETVEQNLLCLHTPRRSYRAILEVSGLNYLLKGEDEQAALSLIFEQILGGLKHPLHVLLRTEPFDQERYLQPFADTSVALPADPILLNADLPDAVRWQRLNSTYCQFFRDLAAGRTLLERHFYLIIPADPVLSPIERMLDALASGGSLLDLSVHILVRGNSQQDLIERSERIQAVLYTMLLKAQPALFEQDRGFRSCLPYAINELSDSGIRLDSASASTSLPFLIPTSMLDDGEQRGILEGVTPAGDPIFLDWWSTVQRNANRIIVAPSGSGKSFKAKLDLIRTAQLYAAAGQPAQQIVIDPEREFVRPGLLALGGQWIRFAAGSEQHVNPFDLPSPDAEDQKTDVLAETIQNAQALFDIMLADRTSQGPGTLSNQEKGLLDRVLYEAYREKGMTTDRRTHTLTPPLLRDVYRILESDACGDDPTGLAARMRRFVSGSLAGLFSGPTNVAMDQSVVIMDSHDLDPELRPIALFLIANFIWTISFSSRIPRQLIVDELLSLYQYPEGRRFLESIFQRARKHYLGVTGMTQHPFILRESTIVSNCGYVALLGQEPSSLDLLTEIFKLSQPERQQLLTFGKGDALLLTHEKRLCVHFACSDLEYRYATSNPVDLARYEAEEREQMKQQTHELVETSLKQPLKKGGAV